MGVVHDKKGLTAGLGERRLPGQVLARAAAAPLSHCPRRTFATYQPGNPPAAEIREGHHSKREVRHEMNAACRASPIGLSPPLHLPELPHPPHQELGRLPTSFICFISAGSGTHHREKSPCQRKPRRPFLAPRSFFSFFFHVELKWKCGPGRPLRPAGHRVPNSRCLGPAGADFDEAQDRTKGQGSQRIRSPLALHESPIIPQQGRG